MKKASILLCTALLIGVLAGCSSNNSTENPAPANNGATTENTGAASGTNSGDTTAEQGQYKDGVYYAIGEVDAKTGWQYYVTLTVASGKITEANWSGINANVGPDKKTYSESGKYGMKAGGASAEWHEQAALAEAYLIEKQDPKDITLTEEGKTDAISGVSVKVKDLFGLADKALAAGPVEAGIYKDGTYHAEADKFAEKSGWKETADVVVAAGKIIHVNFSGVNEAGEDKKQNSIDGKYGMKAGGASSEWHEQAALAESYLVEKQDPASLTFNEEGKTDAISGVSISLKSYYDLVTKALEGAK
ncbi:FMN-binding protein [Paenibacillus sp. FSL K6-1230]|uniref:FMN-binding protein n=1 Tax=Paenibacillus sp. FSL K6-1230 TaxID=2921603 RepID=UPI0030F92CD4